MSNILTSFTDGIINYLLLASVIAAVLTSLAWGIIKVVRIRAPIYRHMVWLYVLIGIVVLPAIWLYGPKLTLAVFPAQIEPDKSAVSEMDTSYAVELAESGAAETFSPYLRSVETSAVAHAAPLGVFSVKGVLTGVWIAVVVFMFGRLAVGWHKIRQICLSAEPISSNVHFVKANSQNTKILLTSQVGSPVCFGILRPLIMLPPEMYNNSTAEDLQMILGHELAHIERRDCWTNLFQRVIEAILFFHPLVWHASVQLTQQREQICDNYVLARGMSATNYVGLLSRIAEQGFENNHLQAVALFEGRLLSRIRWLLDPKHSNKTRLSGRSALLCMLTVSICFLAFGTVRLAAKTQADTNPTSNEAESSDTDNSLTALRGESAQKLRQLGLFLAAYTADHQGKFPDSLQEVLSYGLSKELGRWLEQNVKYRGKGKTTDDALQTGIAYDNNLLQAEADKRTNVLFVDGHIDFIRKDRLEKLRILPESNLEIMDIRIEPIRQGKNVVHVKVGNNSKEDQTFRIQMYTRSPGIGGWGTSFFDDIKAGETKWTRHACKIRGPITDGTYIRLDFHNPAPTASFDMEKWKQKIGWKEWFKRVRYDSSDLEHYKVDESQIKPASKDKADAIIKTLRQLQNHIKSKEYESAWSLFTQDFREAEFQISGFEGFKRKMESPQKFSLSRTELLALEPKTVNTRNGIFTLTAAMQDEYRKVSFLNVDGKWKIDSVERVVPSKLEVLEVKFEPIRQSTNVVRMKIQNNSDKDQTFGIDIRAEAPIRNWQRQFLDTIKASETTMKSFDFEILGPITDDISIRLRFYNPPSANEYDINKWFKQIRYTYKDLEQLGIVQDKPEPASKNEAEAVTNTFKQFQSYLKEEKYEALWKLTAEDIRSGQFQDDFEKFKQQLSEDKARTILLNLHPESVAKSGKFLTLSAREGEQTWKIHFIEEDGQWKIYEGQGPDRTDWQERLLPTMQKRSTKHFDIYYFKDSTAEKEIEQIVQEKEKGFEEICRFLGKDSDQRTTMIFFEDGETKQNATGHQGAGWAFGNTIVEIYNEQQKLDPYHETVHVLMRPFGNPPALFNEGFAVYMSERLGALALKNLSGGSSSIYDRVRKLKNKGEWIPLEELITYTDIGPRWSRPPISYPEAASFVKFLIDKYGKNKFLRAYKKLKSSSDKTIQQQNVRALKEIYGKSLAKLENEWESTFMKSK